jgi:hypothetical protein
MRSGLLDRPVIAAAGTEELALEFVLRRRDGPQGDREDCCQAEQDQEASEHLRFLLDRHRGELIGAACPLFIWRERKSPAGNSGRRALLLSV